MEALAGPLLQIIVFTAILLITTMKKTKRATTKRMKPGVTMMMAETPIRKQPPSTL
jgi:hypothetical protein